MEFTLIVLNVNLEKSLKIVFLDRTFILLCTIFFQTSGASE
jgi:hypothetical protein